MEMTEPDSDQSVGEISAEEGKELKVSPVQAAELEAGDSQWLRMDPSVTRAVLSKTEEELLGSLAALMRNKVEHEEVARRLAQTVVDTQHAKQDLESVRMQVRRAEEEVATRLNEQGRVNEEIARLHEEVANLQQKQDVHTDLVSELTNKTTQMRRSLDEAHENFKAVKEATQAQIATHRETVAQLTQAHYEKSALEESLVPLREEVDGRIRAREALIGDVVILHGHLSELSTKKETHGAEISALENTRLDLLSDIEWLRTDHGALVGQVEDLRKTVAQHADLSDRLNAGLNDLHAEISERAAEQRRLQQSLAEEQTRVSDLLVAKGNLEESIKEAGDKHRALQADLAALSSHLGGPAANSKRALPASGEEGLPLLFTDNTQKIASHWDSYPLESEFHTDDKLDAKKVAELVSALPGLDGCLLVKNRGGVLASRLPERFHALLSVPDRNYELLFDRLKNKLDDRSIDKSRLATYKIGDDALTVAQSESMFLFANHKEPALRPGLTGKLAVIVAEVAKMYP